MGPGGGDAAPTLPVSAPGPGMRPPYTATWPGTPEKCWHRFWIGERGSWAQPQQLLYLEGCTLPMQAPVPGCAGWAVACSEVVPSGVVPAATSTDKAAVGHSTS